MSTDRGLERLAAGVLLPGFAGLTPPQWLASAVADGLAGVVYFGPNIASFEQVTALSAELHGLRDDVLIAVDEEGGDVTRLRAGAGSDLPGNAALGVVDDPDVTAAAARAIGRELRLAGVDLDLAPCVDVNCDPANPVIGVRSFGATPSLVARHGAAFVSGLQSTGVAACAKHYPGHGDTHYDSHLVMPVVHADAPTLRERELPPFAAAVQAGARAVLTAHVSYPALDGALPATLSPALLGLLRVELGFDGVIVTDALDMWAISRTVGTPQGAVAALAAGADLLCLGNPANEPDRGDGEDELRAVWRAVVDAVRAGDLPLARLEQAAGRVAELAGWTRGGRATPLPAAPPAGFGRDVARRALEVSGTVRLATRPQVVDLRRHVNRAAGRTGAALPDELARRAPASWPDGGTVVLVDEPQRDAELQAELGALLAGRPDAVVIATGWPDTRVDLGRNVVRTFGNGRANAEAAVDAVFGRDGAGADGAGTG